MSMADEDVNYASSDYPPSLVEVGNVLGIDASEQCTVPGCTSYAPPKVEAMYSNPIRSQRYTHQMCAECANQYGLSNAIPKGSPMDLAWRLLKEEMPYPDEVDEHGESIDLDQWTRNLQGYYERNPPKWTRDDWAEINRIADNHGGWPPPGVEGVDYPHVADHEWNEGGDWEIHNSHTKRWAELQKKDRQVKEKDMRDKQEWDDVLAEGKELGIYISQGELNQKDTDAMRQRVEAVKHKGEPMDLAWRLLKEDNSWDDDWGHVYDKNDPHTHKCKHCDYPIYHHLQQGDGDGSGPPQEVWSGDDDEGGNCSSPSGFCEPGESLGKTYQSGQPIEATPESHPNRIWLNGRWVDANDWTDEHTAEQEEGKRQFQVDGQMENGNWHDTWDWNSDVQTGEPMDIAWRLLKTPVSPEAKRHKLEYDKKYQDNPKRVKYREELNRERRQRGVYGKGGKDMSHTKDGKIVPEDASKNRARHFKGRGTLKSFVLIKR